MPANLEPSRMRQAPPPESASNPTTRRVQKLLDRGDIASERLPSPCMLGYGPIRPTAAQRFFLNTSGDGHAQVIFSVSHRQGEVGLCGS